MVGKPFSSEEAKVAGSKGGSMTSVIKQISKRKHCASDCPIYETCWARNAADTEYEAQEAKLIKLGKNKEAKLLKPRCALNDAPPAMREHTIRLLKGGEAGFDSLMMNNLLKLGQHYNAVERTSGKVVPTHVMNMLEQLRKTKDSIYGTRQRITELDPEDDPAAVYEEYHRETEVGGSLHKDTAKLGSDSIKEESAEPSK